MNELVNYVRPELLAVSVVLYFIGVGLKTAQFFKDKYIPIALGLIGIALSALFVFPNSGLSSTADIFTAAYTAITQGVLLAGLSTYVNQIIKQLRKDE